MNKHLRGPYIILVWNFTTNSINKLSLEIINQLYNSHLSSIEIGQEIPHGPFAINKLTIWN